MAERRREALRVARKISQRNAAQTRRAQTTARHSKIGLVEVSQIACRRGCQSVFLSPDSPMRHAREGEDEERRRRVDDSRSGQAAVIKSNLLERGKVNGLT